jgi:uncharacterized paraquat-inducible protein A
MIRQANAPWANLPPPERSTYYPGAYDICPRCRVNKKQVNSARCQDCANKYRAIQQHVQGVVKNLIYNKRRVRFHFRDGDGPDIDDGLYDTVTIEWTCRHAWCNKVFTTTDYTDAWVLNDAEAECPRCDTNLVLDQCDARLLRQEVK